MKGPDVQPAKLVALFLLGCLMFNYPLLALFNVADTVLGLPALHLYVFLAWAALIALIAWAVRGSR